MTQKDARFYFVNLGADVARCIAASTEGNTARYESSLQRARATLHQLRKTGRYEAYEEGLLLLRYLEEARAIGNLASLRKNLNNLIATFVGSSNQPHSIVAGGLSEMR